MSIGSIVMCLSVLLGLPVEATRLDGQRASGELKSLTTTALQIEGPSGPVEIPVSELQEVRLTATGGKLAPQQVRLTDEALLAGEKVTISAGALTLESAELGTLNLKTEKVHSVLLGEVDAAQTATWEEMRMKVSQSDLLIVRKGENLDFVGGTIGSVEEGAVTLISRGREVKVPREKIVGIVYATHKIVSGSPACEVATGNGSRLRVKGIEIQEGQARLDLTSGTPLQIPVAALRSLDFGLGRIVPLMKALTRQTLPKGVSEATVAVRNHAYSPSTLQKIPLRLGNKPYSDGLLIHPQTKLEFTLNRQYRQLRTVIGIDENASERARFEPVVLVQIMADGKSVWEQSVRWDTAPVSLDLDVADVRTLEIVTSTEDGKIGPLRHVDLADAKLIK
jgi:NPCBM/NEW2 domain